MNRLDFASHQNINFINQILGGVLSAIFFSLIFSGLLIFADQSRLIDQQTKDKSLTYNLVKPLPNLVWTYGGAILPVIQEFWGQAADAMDTLREKNLLESLWASNEAQWQVWE